MQPFHAETHTSIQFQSNNKFHFQATKPWKEKFVHILRWNVIQWFFVQTKIPNVVDISPLPISGNFIRYWLVIIFACPSETHGGDLVYVQGHCALEFYPACLFGSFNGTRTNQLRQGSRWKGYFKLSCTYGSCLTSGNFQRCRWVSVQSWYPIRALLKYMHKGFN